MAAVLARLSAAAIAGKQQPPLLLQHALRRSAARLVGSGVVPLPLLCSATFLGSNGSRRLTYNAVAGVALGGEKAAAADHHRHAVVGALDDELAGPEEHYSGGAGSSPQSSSREYHSVVAQTEAANDSDGDGDGGGGGGGEKMATRPARGGGKAGVLLAWGEPEQGGGPHYN